MSQNTRALAAADDHRSASLLPNPCQNDVSTGSLVRRHWSQRDLVGRTLRYRDAYRPPEVRVVTLGADVLVGPWDLRQTRKLLERALLDPGDIWRQTVLEELSRPLAYGGVLRQHRCQLRSDGYAARCLGQQPRDLAVDGFGRPTNQVGKIRANRPPSLDQQQFFRVGVHTEKVSQLHQRLQPFALPCEGLGHWIRCAQAGR